MNRNPRQDEAGLILKVLLVVFLVLVALAIFLPALARHRSGHRPSTQNTMKQWGLVLKMYAREDRGERFPPRAEGLWVPDLRVLLPEYVPDPTILLSPRLNEGEEMERVVELATQVPPEWDALHEAMAENFIYTGYALTTPEEIRAFTVTLQAKPKSDLSEDIEAGGNTFYRLREGIERFFVTNINDAAAPSEVQSRLPILVESAFTHDLGRNPPGAYVLYLDGHVDFIRADSDPEFFEALQQLVGSSEQ